MELRPSDLGDAYQTALVLRRAHLPGAAKLPVDSKPTGRVQRWVRGLGLTPEVAGETLPSTYRYTSPVRWAGGMWASMLAVIDIASNVSVESHVIGAAACVACLYTFSELIPGRVARGLYTKLISASEIEAMKAAVAERIEVKAAATPPSSFASLIPGGLQRLFATRPSDTKDPATLETDYFDLILAAMRLPQIDTELQNDLRSTLRQIGSAVAAVRRSEVEEDRTEARDLVGDAEMLAARARLESDVTVAASLLRQAQAKIAQAKMVEKNATLRRQTRALDAELRAQIAAAQSSLRNLTSQVARSAESRGTFRAIAASVTTLANEADSMLRAHDELAVAMAAPTRSVPVTPLATSNGNATVANDHSELRTIESEPAKLINRRRG